MTATPVVLEQNYFHQDVEDLIRRIEDDGRVVRDRRTAEEALLDHLPYSWNELLKAAKAGLYEESKGYRRGTDFWSSQDNVHIERLKKNAKIQQHRIEALVKQTAIAGDPSPLVTAISEWAGKDVRTHKVQVLLNGIPHEHWIQELSFVATAGFTSTRRCCITPARAKPPNPKRISGVSDRDRHAKAVERIQNGVVSENGKNRRLSLS